MDRPGTTILKGVVGLHKKKDFFVPLFLQEEFKRMKIFLQEKKERIRFCCTNKKGGYIIPFCSGSDPLVQ